MMAEKHCTIPVMVALCTFTFSVFHAVAGSISIRTIVSVAEGSIQLRCSSEEDVLRINYPTDDNESELLLSSMQRMELLNGGRRYGDQVHAEVPRDGRDLDYN